MLTHIVLGYNDLAAAIKFYDAVMPTLGYARMMETPSGGVGYGVPEKGMPSFFIGRPRNGEPATFSNGFTLGLGAKTKEAINAFHAAGVAQGGSCEGPPGPREFSPTAYGAYVRDPGGHKICAFIF